MLDAKKEKYCQERASGKSQRQAYYAAYPAGRRWKPETVDNKAYNLEKTDEIKARLRELQSATAKEAGLSRKNLLEKLEQIINTPDIEIRGSDAIKAIELYAKMCGYDAVDTEDNVADKIEKIFEKIGGVI